MSLSWERIAELSIASLSPKEKGSSAVYVDQTLLSPGVVIQVGGREVRVPWQAALAFVDLEPGVNWGHRCRYLVVNATSGEIQTYDEQIPPFLISAPPNLRLVWKGEAVPPWAVVQP